MEAQHLLVREAAAAGELGADVDAELAADDRPRHARRRRPAAGVSVQGLRDFTRAHPQPPALVLGYGLPTVRELRETVAVIADACAAARAA
ncbi:MAG TPA: hypothetical protein VGH14_01540 [Solirubrobacterales bacterium]